MRTWIAIGMAMVVAGCDVDVPCHDLYIVGGSTFDPGAAAIALDPASGTSLIAWSEHRYDATGNWHLQMDYALLASDGNLTPQPPVPSTGDNLWVPAGTDGAYLLFTGSWLLIDAGGVVSRSLPLPTTAYDIADVGVPGGFLVAVGLEDELALYQVAVDGTVTPRGTLGPAPSCGPVPMAAVRVGDAVWFGYCGDDGMNLVRTDLAGTIIDRFVAPATFFAAIASAGDRGLAFDSSGAMYPIDASGVGAATPSPAADPLFAFGFAGLGYLVDATWLDLDGAPIGQLGAYPPQAYPARLVATADSIVATWTTFPESPVVATEPSRMFTTAIPFGAAGPEAAQTRAEASVTVESREVSCPPPTYGD